MTLFHTQSHPLHSKADLEHHFSAAVIPCVNLAIAPARDELRDTITIQVVAVDSDSLVLGLQGKE